MVSTVVVLITVFLAINGALQRALREDVKFFPALAQPYRGVLVTVLALVVEPSLSSMLQGVSVKDAFMAGIVAAAVPLANGAVAILSALTSKGGGAAAAGAVLLLGLLATVGCSGTFNEAQLVERQHRLTATPAPSARCIQLDERHATWGAIAKGAAVMAGASGLATIPVHDQGARIAIGSGVVVAGTLAASAVFVSEAAAESWVRECSP